MFRIFLVLFLGWTIQSQAFDQVEVVGANYLCTSGAPNNDVFYIKSTIPEKVWQSSIDEVQSRRPRGLELPVLNGGFQFARCPHCFSFSVRLFNDLTIEGIMHRASSSDSKIVSDLVLEFYQNKSKGGRNNKIGETTLQCQWIGQ